MSTENLTCGCRIAPDGAPGATGCSAGCMVPEPEDAVTPRPWAVVARYPEPFEPKAAVGHFAAMAYAHHLAYAGSIPTATPDEMRDLTYRHYFPMVAAFTAAASMDESREWTSSLVREAISDGSGVPEVCWLWLTAAGIDPADIAPTQDGGEVAAETTRLLRELYDTARDLDAWTSAQHAEVLRKVEAHLARAGA